MHKPTDREKSIAKRYAAFLLRQPISDLNAVRACGAAQGWLSVANRYGSTRLTLREATAFARGGKC